MNRNACQPGPIVLLFSISVFLKNRLPFLHMSRIVWPFGFVRARKLSKKAILNIRIAFPNKSAHPPHLAHVTALHKAPHYSPFSYIQRRIRPKTIRAHDVAFTHHRILALPYTRAHLFDISDNDGTLVSHSIIHTCALRGATNSLAWTSWIRGINQTSLYRCLSEFYAVTRFA